MSLLTLLKSTHTFCTATHTAVTWVWNYRLRLINAQTAITEICSFTTCTFTASQQPQSRTAFSGITLCLDENYKPMLQPLPYEAIALHHCSTEEKSRKFLGACGLSHLAQLQDRVMIHLTWEWTTMLALDPDKKRITRNKRLLLRYFRVERAHFTLLEWLSADAKANFHDFCLVCIFPFPVHY